MEYYDWDLAETSRTPRNNLFDMTENIFVPKSIKIDKELILNEVKNKHFRSDLI